jgi:hypothetical protein
MAGAATAAPIAAPAAIPGVAMAGAACVISANATYTYQLQVGLHEQVQGLKQVLATLKNPFVKSGKSDPNTQCPPF